MSTTTEAFTRALEKVAKLRALAARATTQAEAETAYAQAEAIIAKYQIDEAQIDTAQAEASEVVGEDAEPLSVGKQRTKWVGILAVRLAGMHGCACCWRGGTSIIIAGRKGDVAIVRYLFAWIRVEIDRLADREYGRATKNAFRLGAVVGATEVMRRAQGQAMRAEPTGHGMAMVLVSRAEVAFAALGKVSAAKGSPAKVRDNDAFARGKRAGESLNARPGLTGAGHRMLTGGAS